MTGAADALTRRDFLERAAGALLAAAGASSGAGCAPRRVAVLAPGATPNAAAAAAGGNWYERSFYLLHLDHHAQPEHAVGRDADPAETRRLIARSRPDVIQIHAKGAPGWTTYPSRVGHTPPHLRRDVMQVWRDVARRDGYRFSAYYNLGRDGVVMERRPAWNRVRVDGKPRDRALCYHTGVAEGHLWPMIDEIMERYAPDGFWFDGSAFTVATCYCAVCRARFRRERGLDLPAAPDAPGWAAFKEMHRQVYREFLAGTVARIKRRDPACLVCVNYAYALHMPEAPIPGMDYLSGDAANEVDRLSREAHWYDGQGRPFDLMTACHVNVGAGAASQPRPKPDGQMEQELAIVVANGGRYFAWDNPTPTSGLVAERHEFIGRVVAPFLRARQRWCQGTERVPELSLLNSRAAHYAFGERDDRCFMSSNAPVSAAAEGLGRHHVDYALVGSHHLAAGDVRGRALVAEHPVALDARDARALRAYVEGGGTLLVTGRGAACAGMPELLGVGAAPSDALRGATVAEPWEAGLPGGAARFEAGLTRVASTGADVLLDARDAAGRAHPLLTRHRVGRGEALFLAVPLFAPSTPDAERAGPTGPAAMFRTGAAPVGTTPEAVQAHVLTVLVPPAHRHVTTDAAATVELVLRRRGGDHVLHLVNRAPGVRERVSDNFLNHTRITDLPPVPPCRVSVRLPARPARVTLEPQGTPLGGWRYAGGRLLADVPAFATHQMVVAHGAT